jgi:hypothetical protein
MEKGLMSFTHQSLFHSKAYHQFPSMLQSNGKEIRMAKTKIDGVIEVVRYTQDGLISLVRTYQRHGAVWSDHILLGRPELIQQLESGKHLVTGLRKAAFGSMFETRSLVRYAGKHILTEGQAAPRDFLAGVPIF